MLLYHAIFAPFLAFGVSFWGLTYRSLLDSISALQKKILRRLKSDKKIQNLEDKESALFSLKSHNFSETLLETSGVVLKIELKSKMVDLFS